MDFLGIRHIFRAFRVSMDGLAEMFRGVAFRQELVIGVVAIALAWTLPGLNVFWGVLLTLCWLLLPTTEVLNTAIEDVVDLASPGIHPLAKRAKDLGSAAVLMVCIGNVIAWCGAIFVVVRHFLNQ